MTLVGLVAYLILMFGIGLYTWHLNKSKEDFIIGGRKLGPWVITFSERTAAESAWLLLGLPGVVFAIGLIEIWTAIGCVLGLSFSWFFVAKRLRDKSSEYDAITLPEYLFKAAGNYRPVRIVSILIIIFFFSFYLAAQFSGAGKVLNQTFGISPVWGMVLGAIVIVFYTLMGGFFAVCYTDMLQGLLMIVTLVILPIVAYHEIGSRNLEIASSFADAPQIFSILGGEIGWAAVAGVIGGLSWGFGYMGQPHLVTKFMAINDSKKIKTGKTIAISWSVPAFLGAVLIGFFGFVLVKNSVITVDDPEKIMPALANFLLPAWFGGILISGAIAAMMSTADSQLLICTSTFVEDFYSKILKKSLSPKGMVLLSRLITFAVGIVAFILAITSEKLIFKLVSYAWCGLGASFGPPLLLSLYWKKITGRGILAGMLTGALTTVIWSEISLLDKLISVRFVAFIFSFLATVIASKMTKK